MVTRTCSSASAPLQRPLRLLHRKACARNNKVSVLQSSSDVLFRSMKNLLVKRRRSSSNDEDSVMENSGLSTSCLCQRFIEPGRQTYRDNASNQQFNWVRNISRLTLRIENHQSRIVYTGHVFLSSSLIVITLDCLYRF